MNSRRTLLLSMVAALLAACGGNPAQPQTVSPQITLPPAATTVQSEIPTALPEPTAAPQPTAAPAEPTAVPQPSSAPAEPTAAPQPSSAPAAGGADELLFLRENGLIALDLGTRAERTIAANVIDFAPAPGGTTIALIRDLGKGSEPDVSGIDLWLIGRDGSGLRQLTNDSYSLIEATPAWAPDGQALAYAASGTSDAYARTWQEWSTWCAGSEVHVRVLSEAAPQSFGPGCDPAISPDGKRIAYATPPSTRAEGENAPNATNAIRLINRQGQNGWNFAVSTAPSAPPEKQGLLVYAPAWSPDGTKLTYQRFIGYRALVDLGMTEIGGSFEGKGQPLSDGAGWLLPAQFSPDGQQVAVVENNYGDARGFGGYDNWSVRVLQLGGTHDVALPDGSITAQGQPVGEVPRARAATWSPAGDKMALLLPPGWKAGLSPNEPYGHDDEPGEIWRWRPGGEPAEQLAKNIDPGSPLAWLP